MGGTSNSRGKSGARDLLAPSSNDDDEAQLNSDLLNAWTQRLQILTVVVRRQWCLFDRIYHYDTTSSRLPFWHQQMECSSP